MEISRCGLVVLLLGFLINSTAADLFAVKHLGNTQSPAFYSIDVNTGTESPIATISAAFGLNSLTAIGSQLYSAGATLPEFQNRLLTIDRYSGAVTLGAQLSFPFANANSVGALAYHPSHGLLAKGINDELIRVDIATGQGTLIAIMQQPFQPVGVQGMAFSPDGRLFGFGVERFGLIEINPLTAEISDVSAIGGTQGILQALEFLPDGRLIGGYNGLFSLDTSTGLPTLIGSPGSITNIRGLAYLPSIPEPSSASLLLVSYLVCSYHRRKRINSN